MRVPKGYGIFFPGSVLHHNVVGIKPAPGSTELQGVRHSIDLFVADMSDRIYKRFKNHRGRKQNSGKDRGKPAPKRKVKGQLGKGDAKRRKQTAAGGVEAGAGGTELLVGREIVDHIVSASEED